MQYLCLSFPLSKYTSFNRSGNREMLCDIFIRSFRLLLNLVSPAIGMQTMRKLLRFQQWSFYSFNYKISEGPKNFIISPLRWEQRFCVHFPSSYWVCPRCQSRLAQSVSSAPSVLGSLQHKDCQLTAQLCSITGFYITFGERKLTFLGCNVIGPASDAMEV